MQSFFKFLSKLNFILLASALLYSTSLNSHQISWLGASYVSVLRRACTWVYKQANFSQIGHYHFGSCPASTTAPPLQSSLHHRLLPWSWLRCGAASPGGPIPSPLKFVLEGPCPVDYCFSWISHSQSTKVSPGGPMPGRLKFALEDPCPVDYCFSWISHAQSTKVCPRGPMPSRLKFYPGGPMPSRLKFALEDPCPVD